MARTHVTRREYNDWILGAGALARALRYPIDESMLNDSAGIVFGDDQYEAFEAGIWSGDPAEMMIIFESLNEPAVDGLPIAGIPFSEYSGLCDKLMIVHPGKFCPPHFHKRKTESYEVVLGEMDVFYSTDAVDTGDGEVVAVQGMPAGNAWPESIVLTPGREHAYAELTQYKRIVAGDPKFVMHRKHLHAFGCPADAKVPLVVREVSTFSHEPTEEVKGNAAVLDEWNGIHDNQFLAEAANSGRLTTHIQ